MSTLSEGQMKYIAGMTARLWGVSLNLFGEDDPFWIWTSLSPKERTQILEMWWDYLEELKERKLI